MLKSKEKGQGIQKPLLTTTTLTQSVKSHGQGSAETDPYEETTALLAAQEAAETTNCSGPNDAAQGEQEHAQIYELYNEILSREFNEQDRASLQRLTKSEDLHKKSEGKNEASEIDFERVEVGEIGSRNRVLFLDCKEGVTTCNILSMFGVFFTNFSFSSYMFFVLIFLLEDPITFKMTPETALSQASWLIFLGYPFNVLSSIVSGYLFVKFGRRKIILAGFILGITATFLVPFIGLTLYPNLLMLIACINVGTAWTQNPPLIADYVRPSSIGLAYAMQGLLTFMATIFAVAVLFGGTKTLPFQEAIMIVCPTLYLMAFLAAFGIKEVKPVAESQPAGAEASDSERVTSGAAIDEHQDGAMRSLGLQLRILCHFSLADCVYNVAYAGYFVSEMGYLLSFVYINAWTSQFFFDQEDGLEQAKALSEQITTCSMVIGLMAGLLLGHVIDSCRITPMLLLCFLLRGVGLFMMTLGISDFAEQKAMLYCSIFAMTTGTFCQTIVVQSLLNKRLIAPTREIMNGMSQAMRALGVMTVTGLGSVVAKANVNAPFLLVGCFDMAFVLAILVLVGLRKLTV